LDCAKCHQISQRSDWDSKNSLDFPTPACRGRLVDQGHSLSPNSDDFVVDERKESENECCLAEVSPEVCLSLGAVE
jgi:hypothetical protein